MIQIDISSYETNGRKMKRNTYSKLTFAEILDDAIHCSPYNNTTIAQKLGVSKSTVSNWVNGVRKPDIDMVIQLCILLDIDIYYMIGATIPCNELHPKEQELLRLYRNMNEKEKLALLYIANTIANKN